MQLRAGRYTITVTPVLRNNNVTVRGSTGNAADVIVQGLGMNVNPGSSTKEGFNLYGSNITIKDLTVQEFFNHAIHFQPGANNMLITNVITRNNGQQHIKGAQFNNGGIIRNCFVYARTGTPISPDQPWTGNADVGIDLAFVRSVQMYDTTKYPDTNLQLAYNIVRGNYNNLSGGGFTDIGRITGNTPQANWFVNPGAADYHLTRLATPAIDHAALLPEVVSDYDQQTRPSGALPDVGADEYLWGDINGDNEVKVAGLQLLVTAWGSSSADGTWNANADFNGDNYINVGDLQILVNNWGR